MRNQISILFFAFMISACSTQQEDLTDGALIIDFTESTETITLNLSDISDDYEMIFLETTDESLLRYFDVFVLEDALLAVAPDKVVRFGLDGSYQRTILEKGEGPEQFKNMNSYDLGPAAKNIYIYERGRGIRVFGLDSGRLVQTIPLARIGIDEGTYSLSNFAVLENGDIMALRGALARVPYLVFRQTPAGELLSGIKRPSPPARDRWAGAVPMFLSFRSDSILFQGSDSLSVQSLGDTSATTVMRFKVDPPQKKGDTTVSVLPQFRFETKHFMYLVKLTQQKIKKADYMGLRMVDASQYLFNRKSGELKKIDGIYHNDLGVLLPEAGITSLNDGRFRVMVHPALLIEKLEEALKEKPVNANLPAIRELSKKLDPEGNLVMIMGSFK